MNLDDRLFALIPKSFPDPREVVIGMKDRAFDLDRDLHTMTDDQLKFEIADTIMSYLEDDVYAEDLTEDQAKGLILFADSIKITRSHGTPTTKEVMIAVIERNTSMRFI